MSWQNIQVCWKQHTIQSFRDSIRAFMSLHERFSLGILRNCSIRGNMMYCNLKSWVNAMRVHVYESFVTATLLQRFILNFKRCIDDIEQYLEITLIQSTGPHWVDNFVLPTLLIHQLEDAEREGEVHLKQLTVEPNGEVFHHCWTCPVCMTHYSAYNGNLCSFRRQCLSPLLSPGWILECTFIREVCWSNFHYNQPEGA